MLLERKLSVRGRNVGGAAGNSLPRKVASPRFSGDSLRFRENDGWMFGPKSYLRKNRAGRNAAEGSRELLLRLSREERAGRAAGQWSATEESNKDCRGGISGRRGRSVERKRKSPPRLKIKRNVTAGGGATTANYSRKTWGRQRRRRGGERWTQEVTSVCCYPAAHWGTAVRLRRAGVANKRLSRKTQ